jgi:hypothetical protein
MYIIEFTDLVKGSRVKYLNNTGFITFNSALRESKLIYKEQQNRIKNGGKMLRGFILIIPLK